MSREAVTKAKRVVLKVGSSSLTGAAGSALDASAVEKIVELATSLRNRGAEVLIVSSGAIAAGLAPLKLTTRPKDLPTQQAAASVGQGLLIAKYSELFAQRSLVSSQVLLTTEDVVRRSHYNTAQQTLSKLLSLGVIPVINENDSVGTAEIRFGDNDRLAALIALLVQADLLVLISDVDALYDAHPSQPGAKAIHEVADFNEIASVEIGGAGSAGVGSGGMVTKIEAARIATSAGIPMLLTSLAQSPDSLAGQEFGTLFAAQSARANSRLLWLAHASSARGRLILDAGAVKAILERGVSLLPAGVTSVEGSFGAGDTIELVGPDGVVIARGLVAFESEDIPQMLGRSTKELAASLGAEYERELVHRDDLVLL
jgi:glutamate 5-kinase